MNTKIFKSVLCVILMLSVTVFSGCEKMMDMVSTTDDAMPTLRVGLIHPHPNYTSFGKAAELARDEINAAGGVLGMQVELVFKKETTDTVVQAATDLVEMDNVVAILGPLFSSHAVKVGPVASVPVLLGATRAEVTADETDPNDLMFLIGGSNVLQAKLLAKHVKETLMKDTAGMIWQNMDVYSEGFVESFKSSFEELGGTVVVEQTYESGDTIMFETQLSAVMEADPVPDVLLLASFPKANPHIMKQAREIGIESIFIGSDGWDDPLMSTTLEDNSPVDGFYCTNLDPDAMAFNTAYMEKYGSVDGIAASGYDAMKILAMAIKAVGAADDPMAIRDAIAAITDYEGATTILRFDENRNPVKSVGVREITDGIPHPSSEIIEAEPE